MNSIKTLLQKNKEPLIMGVLNVTPDSFSDGGKFITPNTARQHVDMMITNGAAIIDIGAESTRPGAKIVTVDEERKRIEPVVKAIKKEFNIPVSIDTYKPEIMELCIDLGVDMINDIYALRQPGALEIVANSDVMLCLMHMQGTPKTMQDNPTYTDVIAEIIDFLNLQAKKAIATGVKKNKIIVDPGIGFGKTTAHNIEILKNLNKISNMGYLSLLGTSRKKLFSEVAENNNPLDRVSGTCATSTLGVMASINIFRVHDVWQNKQAIDVAFAIKNI